MGDKETSDSKRTSFLFTKHGYRLSKPFKYGDVAMPSIREFNTDTNRVADLKHRIKTISDDSLGNIKNSLRQKFGSDVSEYTERRLEEIRKFSPKEMRQELWDKVDGLKAYDTIAVMSSKEGNYLATGGNLMSPHIPDADLHDTGLWGDVLVVKKVERGNQLYEWRSKYFGLQDADHPAIIRALEAESSEDGVKWTYRDVYVVNKVEPPAGLGGRKVEEIGRASCRERV